MLKWADVSEVRTAFVTRAIWRYIPDDSTLQTRHRKNLKAHIIIKYSEYRFSTATLKPVSYTCNHRTLNVNIYLAGHSAVSFSFPASVYIYLFYTLSITFTTSSFFYFIPTSSILYLIFCSFISLKRRIFPYNSLGVSLSHFHLYITWNIFVFRPAGNPQFHTFYYFHYYSAHVSFLHSSFQNSMG
jgi:hypothetical protein